MIKRNFYLMIILLFLVRPCFGAELFNTYWNTATGSTENALTDGGTWDDHEDSNCEQTCTVVSGGPGDNNFLRMRTCGTAGFSDPDYEQWLTVEDEWTAVADLYVRFYWRVNDTYNADENMHWFMLGENGDGYYGQQILVSTESYLNCPGDFCFGIANGGSNNWYDWENTYEYDTWYLVEYNIKEVSGGQHYHVKIDEVSIDDDLVSVEGPGYDDSLTVYQASNEFSDTDNTKLWIASYQGYSPLNDGLDIAALEIRDDGWIGPLGGDSTPPATSGWSPAKSETGVSISEDIVFHVTDGGDGVDGTTIEVDVEGTVYCCSDGSCGNKTLGRSGTTADYTITYTHADWGYLQEINVEIDADDLASPPNSMTTDIYSFTTESEPVADVPTSSGASGGGSMN